MPRPTYIIFLLATHYCQYIQAYGYLGAHNIVSDGAESPRSLCPYAEDIAPCICTYDEHDDAINMNCTGIADEQELYDVFHSDIPFPRFQRFDLTPTHLTNLSDAVFGDSIFEEVVVWEGNLEYIGPGTFIKSASTLTNLTFYSNNINEFPFETISQYTQLGKLLFYDNPISSFPIISSETLYYFKLAKTEWHDIPEGAFVGLPNLVHLDLFENRIDSMAKELFTPLHKLKDLLIHNADLTHLESLQFAFNSSDLKSITMNNNFIETVDPDAFKGVECEKISLWNNRLTELPESTWKPLMEAGVQLILTANNFTCGCDVAWLVLEPSYHTLVSSAKCNSGDMLIDLDPQWFQDNC